MRHEEAARQLPLQELGQLNLDEIRQGYKCDATRNKQERIGNTNTDRSSGSDSTEQRNDRLLLLAVNEKTQPDRAEQQAPQKQNVFMASSPAT